jgi:hypothetical protein
MTDFEEYLYIDYENVQDVNVNVIKKTTKLMIILGNDQTKVPVELIQKIQKLGERVKWIRVNGKGRNALDFFIVFFLGRDITLDKNKKFIIYSKDTGYDPLINYLKKNGINIIRIEGFQELSQNKEVAVIKRLKKVAANNRPKKRTRLAGFITGTFKNATKEDINNIIENLFIEKVVYEENGIIKYSFTK